MAVDRSGSGADRSGAEIEHQQRTGQARKKRADDEGKQLVFDHIEAQCTCLDPVLSAGLQDQADHDDAQLAPEKTRPPPSAQGRNAIAG